MTPRYLVVSCSPEYLPGLRVLLASAHHYMPEVRQHVLAYGLGPSIVNGLRSNGVEVTLLDESEEQRLACNARRHLYAANLPGIVCLLDADMIVTHECEALWRIAEAGLIVGGTNASPFRFTQAWRDKYDLVQLPLRVWARTMTTVPLFLDSQLHGGLLRHTGNWCLAENQWCDFTAINMWAAMLAKESDLWLLPAQQVTGIHHFQMKPNTRVMEVGGRLLTEDGLDVLFAHGKFWQDVWCEQVMIPMREFAGGDARIVAGAAESLALLRREWAQWSKSDE